MHHYSKTILLLNNNAFDDIGKILQTLTGKASGPVRAADKTRLTNVLKYHIIDKEYIMQIAPLKPTIPITFSRSSTMATTEKYYSDTIRCIESRSIPQPFFRLLPPGGVVLLARTTYAMPMALPMY